MNTKQAAASQQERIPTLAGNREFARGWREFDANWYAKRYAMGDLSPDNLLEHYQETGAGLGRSPNPFFDEEWYLAKYNYIADAVRRGDFNSGYQHFWETGHADHAPHWLFDPKAYLEALERANVEDRAAAIADPYDHYLTIGQWKGLQPCPFFDPQVYADSLPASPAGGLSSEGAFGHYLRRLGEGTPDIPVSHYLDPSDYLRRYSHVAVQIMMGKWRSALHHFLTTPEPHKFHPSALFDEREYLRLNPDLAGTLKGGTPRAAYASFIVSGIAERRPFNEAIDLQRYVARYPVVLEDIAVGLVPDAYAHFMRVGRRYGLSAAAELAPVGVIEDATRKIFKDNATLNALVLASRKIDFSFDGKPELSVIVVAHNQFAMTMSALASLRANYAGKIELILIDSGSTDRTRQITDHVQGARVIVLEDNLGYLAGCNIGLTHVRAPALLFLNNDVLLAPAAVANALRRLRSAPDIGAVGAKLVRTSGVLQEAGSTIFRDGSCRGYLRNASPLAPEANFARDVDYCSGAFLLAAADLVKTLGGFDPRYAPAYYEETDLCVRMLRAGKRVVYDPSIVVTHLEFGSAEVPDAAVRQMRKNQLVFEKRHRAWLRTQPATDCSAVFARQRSRRSRVLVIEDRVPLPALGSGFGRTNDIVAHLVDLGLDATVYPTSRSTEDMTDLYAAFPDSVEIMHDRDASGLATFLEERRDYYDRIWVCRAHNLQHVTAADHGLPATSIIVDTEAIFSVRDMQRAELAGASDHFDLGQAIAHEFRHADMRNPAIAVNELDRTLLKSAGFENVSVLGHSTLPRLTKPGFDARKNLLFVGALHQTDSPNMDSLHWFTDHVLEHVVRELGDVTLTVAGFVGPGVDLTKLAGNPNVNVVGPVGDLSDLYASHRVFVAPTRLASGIPRKVHEAASYGLPIVMSDILLRQTGWQAGIDALSSDTYDPINFAAEIVRLYRSERLWRALRKAAAQRILVENDPAIFAQAIRQALSLDLKPRKLA